MRRIARRGAGRAPAETTICPRVDGSTVSPATRRPCAGSAGLLDEAVRLARDEVAAVGDADVQRLPAAAQREQQPVRLRRATTAAIATEPSNDATVRRNASSSDSPSRMRRATSIGMIFASVVISCGDLEVFGRRDVRVVVDVAVEHREHERSSRRLVARQRVRVGLGDHPDARPPRVPEDGRRAPSSRRRAWCSSASSRIASRIARVLSPSSPTSAAAL